MQRFFGSPAVRAERFCQLLLIICAVISLLPFSAFLNPALIVSFYGIVPENPTASLLLQHRALFFGIIGGMLLSAAFWPPIRLGAIAVALASKIGFVLLVLGRADISPHISRIVAFDAVAITLLLCCLFIIIRQRNNP